MFNILFIAVGLAMDAFSVSITSGITLKKVNLKHYLLFGTVFGAFQFIMPILGYYGAIIFSNSFSKYSNLLSFLILFLIGLKMIYEAVSNKDNDEKSEDELIKFKNMCFLGIATSIDALAIGVMFQINNSPIFLNSVIIGLCAFIFSFSGVYLGKKVGNLIGNNAEILGGLILIFLGINFIM